MRGLYSGVPLSCAGDTKRYQVKTPCAMCPTEGQPPRWESNPRPLSQSTHSQPLNHIGGVTDDLLIITKGSFQDHLDKLEQVLTRLAEAGLKVNVSKSHFCHHELEYLGYLINREGVRPSMKKVEAIRNIAPPKTRKQVRSFIGMKTIIEICGQSDHIS